MSADKKKIPPVYNKVFPSHDGTSVMTGNIGDGYAKITFIEKIVE